MPLIQSGSREAIGQNIHEMLSSGHPRAQAIAVALNTARHAGGIRRDVGGQVDPTATGIGGIAPSVQSMNPLERGLAQRYAALSIERLQEVAAMQGGTQSGQIARQVLRQKQLQTTPQAVPGAPMAGIAPQAPSPPQIARGGLVPGLAMGGNPMGISASAADPAWERQEIYGSERPLAHGFLAGTTPGRADSIQTQAPGGSYIIPSDVIAGLGEGNSLAGAHIAEQMFGTGPHGIPLPRGGRGHGPPAPPHMAMPEAKGGGVQPGSMRGTPVLLSHGEFSIDPRVVAKLGGGNLKRGIKVLDIFVQKERAKHIKELKALPPPVGAKKV